MCTLRATLTNDQMLLRSYRLFNDRLPPPSPSPSLPFSLPTQRVHAVFTLTFAFWRIDRYGCNNRIWIKRSQRDSRTSAREDSRESLGANSKAIPFVNLYMRIRSTLNALSRDIGEDSESAFRNRNRLLASINANETFLPSRFHVEGKHAITYRANDAI